MNRIFNLKNYPAKTSAIIICSLFILALIIGDIFIESDYPRKTRDIGFIIFFVLIIISLFWSLLHPILIIIGKSNQKNKHMWLIIGLLPLSNYLFTILKTF
jgi:fucose permease